MHPCPDSNPLLEIEALPAFSEIRPEHVSPALDQILEDNRRSVKQLETMAGNATWTNFVQLLEDLDENLSKMWSPVSHLNAVKRQ